MYKTSIDGWQESWPMWGHSLIPSTDHANWGRFLVMFCFVQSLEGSIRGLQAGQPQFPGKAVKKSFWKPFPSTWRTRGWLGTANTVLSRVNPSLATLPPPMMGWWAQWTKEQQWMLCILTFTRPSDRVSHSMLTAKSIRFRQLAYKVGGK